MQIVTGYRGTPHITANDEQGRNQGTYGSGNYILDVGSKMAPTVISANEIQIADGEGMFQGVHFRVDPGTYDAVTIENGTQGMKRKDLIVARYTKNATTGVEALEWAVKKGTPTSGTAVLPSATEGDILNGDLVAEMPFAEVNISGITISSVNRIPGSIKSLSEILSQISEPAFMVVEVTSEYRDFLCGKSYSMPYTVVSGYHPTNLMAIKSNGFVAAFYGYIDGSNVTCWSPGSMAIPFEQVVGWGSITATILYVKN